MPADFAPLARRLEALIERAEEILLPQTAAQINDELDSAIAFRWDSHPSPLGARRLFAIQNPPPFDLADLRFVGEQLALLEENTRRFIGGLPAQNALLTGPRGCGKSSMVRGLLHKYANRGLRLIETDPDGLARLAELRRVIGARDEKFIVYCDDLTFSSLSSSAAGRESFRAIKTALDGALDGGGGMLVYATSNRRHLIPEQMEENLRDEIHPAETIEEKIALSDRFGLWTPFFAPDHKEYLAIVRHWLARLGAAADDKTMRDAARFAAERGSSNGRIAYQFALSKAARSDKQTARGKRRLQKSKK
jgi:predicted AAA+ superfamily ATPase